MWLLLLGGRQQRTWAYEDVELFSAAIWRSAIEYLACEAVGLFIGVIRRLVPEYTPWEVVGSGCRTCCCSFWDGGNRAYGLRGRGTSHCSAKLVGGRAYGLRVVGLFIVVIGRSVAKHTSGEVVEL